MKGKKRGLTLVELVVVIALVTIVGGMIMTLFLSQNESMNYVHDSTAIQDDARTILNSLENDIRVAKNRNFPARTGATKDMLYSYEVKVSDTQTDKFAYFLDSSTHSVVKAKMNASGTYEDIASLSRYVKSISITQDTNVTDTNKVYNIELVMKKGKEELPSKVTVACRN